MKISLKWVLKKLPPAHSVVAVVAVLAVFAKNANAGTGTSAFAFLQIPVAARAMALGGGSTAVADDASMGSINPAGFPEAGSLDVLVSRTYYWQDVTFDSLSGAYVVKPGFLIGVDVLAAGYGVLNRQVERSDGTFDASASGAAFSAGSLAIGGRGALSFKLLVPMKAGVGVHWVKEELDGEIITGVLADVGVIADHLLPAVTRMILAENFSLGASLTKWGSNVKGAETPTTFRVGAGLRWSVVPILLIVDLEWPLAQTARGQIGVESWMWDQLVLRMGYRTGPDRPHPTIGMGWRLMKESIGYQVDYALEAPGLFGGTHRLSLGIRLQ